MLQVENGVRFLSNCCLICRTKILVSGKRTVNIFSESAKTQFQGTRLINLLHELISKDLKSCHSEVICNQCLKNLNLIDLYQSKLAVLSQEIKTQFLETEAFFSKNIPDKCTELDHDDEEMLRHDKVYRISTKDAERNRRLSSKIGRLKKQNLSKRKANSGAESGGNRSLLNGSNLIVINESDQKNGSDDETDSNLMVIDGSEDENNSNSTAIDKLLDKKDSNLVSHEDENIMVLDGLDLDNENDYIIIGGMTLPTFRRSRSEENSNKSTNESLQSTNSFCTNERNISLRGNERKNSLCVNEGKNPTNEQTALICRYCSFTTSTFKLIDAHLRQKHKDDLYNCEVCLEEFSSKSDLLQHLDRHAESSRRPYSCDQCKRRYSLPSHFRFHVQNHCKKKIPCFLCAKNLRTEAGLQEHLNTHTGYKPYICEGCKKCFSSKILLKIHLKTHTHRRRDFQCDVCHSSFLNVGHLREHKEIHAHKRFICETCGKIFKSQKYLEGHASTHSGVKDYVCGNCSKAFLRKKELRDHMRVHTGEKPFQCEICGATFAQRSNLLTHKRSTHFNIKKHQCAHCHKAFKRRRLLVYHTMSAHTGEKPYKCEICNAAFVYPEHLKKHLLIHKGQKPFNCEICDKTFTSKDNKNVHKFIHSDRRQYECLLCGAGFMRKPQIIIHFSEAHPNSEISKDNIKFNSADDITVKPIKFRAEEAKVKEITVSSVKESIESGVKEFTAGSVKEVTAASVNEPTSGSVKEVKTGIFVNLTEEISKIALKRNTSGTQVLPGICIQNCGRRADFTSSETGVVTVGTTHEVVEVVSQSEVPTDFQILNANGVSRYIIEQKSRSHAQDLEQFLSSVEGQVVEIRAAPGSSGSGDISNFIAQSFINSEQNANNGSGQIRVIQLQVDNPEKCKTA